MNIIIRYSLFIVVTLSSWAFANQEKFTIGFFLDIGRVESGEAFRGGSGENLKGDILQRTLAFINYQKSFPSQFSIDITLGALFWKAYESGAAALVPGGEHAIRSGLGVSSISFTQKFANNFKVNFGILNYKYNTESKNLGEYLLRSEAYPTILVTGGWSFINSSVYNAPGVILEWDLFDGLLENDFLLLAEYNNVPFLDISPSYVIKINLQWFQVGGGFSFHRFIHNRGGEFVIYKEDENQNKIDSLTLAFQAQKAVVFSHIDLGKILNWKKEEIGSFGVYGEIAWLGFDNYFNYYKSIKERNPMMLGFNIPTFGLLDLLSVEVEYFKNPNLDSRFNQNGVALPAKETFEGKYTRDDWKWNVYLSKNILEGVGVLLQVANDHQRLRTNLGRETDRPITQTLRDWYWVFRFQWII